MSMAQAILTWTPQVVCTPCEMGCGHVVKFTTSKSLAALGQGINIDKMAELWKAYGVHADDVALMMSGQRPGGLGKARKMSATDTSGV